jgi:hypothetical protein
MDRWQEYLKSKEKTDALKKSNNPKDHDKVLAMLIEAGNQAGVFDGIFSQLNQASDSFKKYIVPKVVEHQFYRYKCVVDGIAWGFGLDYPIKDSKKFILMVNDILSGSFNKYLATTDTTVIYTLFALLYLVDLKAYRSYFENALISSDKYKRFMALYFTSRRRTDKLSICNTYFAQDDIEMYSPLLACIPSYHIFSAKDSKVKPGCGGRTEESLYYKLCDLSERLPKKNIVYKTSEEIWFQHGIGRDELSGKIFYLLLALKDKKLIRHYEDKYYGDLDAKEKVTFINLFTPYLRQDYRREMLNYFSYKESYYYGVDKNEKYFVSKPLTFDLRFMTARR